MSFLAFLQEHGVENAADAGRDTAAAPHGAGHGEVSPIVTAINDAIGPATVPIQRAVMEPIYGLFGAHWTPPAHGQEIPAHVIMAFVAFLICTLGLWLFRGRLSVDNPSRRQQALEVLVGNVRTMLDEVVGPYGRRYLAVIGAFAVFILVSNFMGLIPLLEAPTGNFNVPLALGICSFGYYITMGFRQQGLGYLKHFTGGIGGGFLAPLAAVIFLIEVVSNFIRPVTLGVRLFLNMFADHTIGGIFSGLMPWLVPILLPIPLAAFVALIQTLVFVVLSMVYLSETVPHEEHDHDEHGEHASLAERQAAHAH
jgi:F-type H+-transporting ATPase subunit a